MIDYKHKYLKYKQKYLELKQKGGYDLDKFKTRYRKKLDITNPNVKFYKDKYTNNILINLDIDKKVDFDRYLDKDNFVKPDKDNYNLFTKDGDESIIIGKLKIKEKIILPDPKTKNFNTNINEQLPFDFLCKSNYESTNIFFVYYFNENDNIYEEIIDFRKKLLDIPIDKYNLFDITSPHFTLFTLMCDNQYRDIYMDILEKEFENIKQKFNELLENFEISLTDKLKILGQHNDCNQHLNNKKDELVVEIEIKKRIIKFGKKKSYIEELNKFKSYIEELLLTSIVEQKDKDYLKIGFINKKNDLTGPNNDEDNYYKIYYIEKKTPLIYIPKISLEDINPYIPLCNINININYWRYKGIGEFIKNELLNGFEYSKDVINYFFMTHKVFKEENIKINEKKGEIYSNRLSINFTKLFGNNQTININSKLNINGISLPILIPDKKYPITIDSGNDIYKYNELLKLNIPTINIPKYYVIDHKKPVFDTTNKSISSHYIYWNIKQPNLDEKKIVDNFNTLVDKIITNRNPKILRIYGHNVGGISIKDSLDVNNNKYESLLCKERLVDGLELISYVNTIKTPNNFKTHIEPKKSEELIELDYRQLIGTDDEADIYCFQEYNFQDLITIYIKKDHDAYTVDPPDGAIPEYKFGKKFDGIPRLIEYLIEYQNTRTKDKYSINVLNVHGFILGETSNYSQIIRADLLFKRIVELVDIEEKNVIILGDFNYNFITQNLMNLKLYIHAKGKLKKAFDDIIMNITKIKGLYNYKEGKIGGAIQYVTNRWGIKRDNDKYKFNEIYEKPGEYINNVDYILVSNDLLDILDYEYKIIEKNPVFSNTLGDILDPINHLVNDFDHQAYLATFKFKLKTDYKFIYD